jgi:hypothetical protein
VLELVRQARRRLLYNEFLCEGANAFSAALIAFILLLLFGTQILNWYWVLLIPVVAAGIGVYRSVKRVPTTYGTAQLVDHRMDLADTVSTAVFLSQPEAARRVDPAILRWQAESAERLAQTVDVRRAVPYAIPRTIYLMGALVLVASSLFALRYGLNRRLDLKPPLARLFQHTPGPEDRKEVAENVRKKDRQQNPDPDDDNGASVADPDKKGQDQQDSPSENSAEQTGDQSSDKAGAKEDGKKQDGQGKDSDAQDSQAEGQQDKQDENQSGAAKQGDKSDGKQSEGKQNGKNSSENSSLMSKFKDAVQNLISSMKPPQNGGNQSQDQKSQQGKSQQSSGKQQQQQPGKDGQPQSGSQQADAQQGQPGADQKDSQESPGKGTGKSDSQQANKQPGSGIGSEDGNKRIKDAEQLAAMGKISELFGKRSANITGEATVEVQSTSQQLHTAYSQRSAEHSQGGAEITRDEIPVALQGYVEQYFEQVRKQATPVAAPAVVKK